MYLYKHPRETKKNRDRAGRLISEWARPIFNLSADMRAMTREERLQRDLEQMPKKKRASPEPGTSSKNKQKELTSFTGGERYVPTTNGFSKKMLIKSYIFKKKKKNISV